MIWGAKKRCWWWVSTYVVWRGRVLLKHRASSHQVDESGGTSFFCSETTSRRRLSAVSPIGRRIAHPRCHSLLSFFVRHSTFPISRHRLARFFDSHRSWFFLLRHCHIKVLIQSQHLTNSWVFPVCYSISWLNLSKGQVSHIELEASSRDHSQSRSKGIICQKGLDRTQQGLLRIDKIYF